MTTPSPVSAVPGFVIPGNNPVSQPVIKIYTLNTDLPERIEAVTMSLVYQDDPPEVTNDMFVIELRDVSGVAIYRQASPIVVGQIHLPSTVYLTWSRQGNDTSQNSMTVYEDSTDTFSVSYANMRLPDLVLQPGSFINLAAYRDENDEEPDLSVSDCAVTVTRNAGPASTVISGGALPFLVPQG